MVYTSFWHLNTQRWEFEKEIWINLRDKTKHSHKTEHMKQENSAEIMLKYCHLPMQIFVFKDSTGSGQHCVSLQHISLKLLFWKASLNLI